MGGGSPEAESRLRAGIGVRVGGRGANGRGLSCLEEAGTGTHHSPGLHGQNLGPRSALLLTCFYMEYKRSESMKRCSVLPASRKWGVKIHDLPSPNDANQSHGGAETAQEKSRE